MIIDNVEFDLTEDEVVVNGMEPGLLLWVSVSGSGVSDIGVPIPATVGGYPVTRIRDDALGSFRQRVALGGELTLPSTITYIGDSAFDGCVNLLGSIHIGSNCKYIGEHAFRLCASLQGTVQVDSSCEIGEGAFDRSGLTVTQTGTDHWFETIYGVYYQYADGVLSVVGSQKGITGLRLVGEVNGVPVTRIAESAFEDRPELKGPLTIPETVTRIGGKAFKGCTGLTQLTMGSGVSLGSSVFAGCVNLTGTLTLPADSKWVYSDFESTKLNVENADGSRWLTMVDGVYYMYQVNYVNYPPEPVTALVICGAHPDTHTLNLQSTVRGIAVTEIYFNTFSGRKDLTGGLNLPDGLERIRDGAFRGCSGLTGELIIPPGVFSIGGDAFRSCSGFTGTVVIPRGCIMGLCVFDSTNLVEVQAE